VIAIRRPELDVVLVDRRARRTDLLRLASSQLDLAARVTVLDADVVALGGDPKYTRSFDVVTARAFGEPLWTLECAAPFLRPGGFYIVSEPPPAEITRDRWPGESVTELGFTPSPLQFPGVRRFERW
jgi:16S rRNA G527 N7-methylase RsmG